MTQTLIGVCLLAFFLLRLPDPIQSQPLPETQGYTCDANQTATYPCQTYAFYRAASPSFLDLASIGDLFEVSRLMIAEPSNITYPNATLFPDQPLFVPITCSCNRLQTNDSTNITSISYANISYTIKSGDTFYDLSTAKFENLTTYQSVEAVNPTLVVTNLSVGAEAIFPIFCKCPDANTTGTRPNYLVSYVFQPSDNVSTVASLFNVSSQSITDLNGNDPQPFETVFVPVSRLPNLTQPTTFPSAPSTKTDRKGVIIGLSIGIGILGIALILMILLWMCCGYQARKMDYYEEDEEKIKNDKTMSRKGEAEVSLMADVSGCLDKYRVFKMNELREATEGFSPRCLIQGSVYRGVIDGEVFAIKKMNWNASEELKILQKVNHGNLVKLEGFCIDPEDGNCYLIYEFVENGSLHSWIHENKAEKLNWKTRLRIAIDVANGLQYIHEHTRPRVVHKDIKSSNILLDSSMRAKIANFGLAKSGCNAITMHIVGTQGYIAPEYLSDGVVSTRMDVFSFGVVLLELISGKEAVDAEGRVMWATAVEMFDGEDLKQRKLRGWMDDSLMADTISIESVASVLNVAMSCLNKDPAKRPGMVEIVYTLSKSDDVFFDTSEDGPSIQPLLAR